MEIGIRKAKGNNEVWFSGQMASLSQVMGISTKRRHEGRERTSWETGRVKARKEAGRGEQ